MQALLTGIYTLFNADPSGAFYTDVAGRMYTRRAPEGTPYPYAVLILPTLPHTWTFDSDHYTVDVQFNIFSQSESETEIGDMYDHLVALFDDCSLTVAGWTAMKMVRTNAVPNDDAMEGVRGWSIMYEVELYKSR